MKRSISAGGVSTTRSPSFTPPSLTWLNSSDQEPTLDLADNDVDAGGQANLPRHIRLDQLDRHLEVHHSLKRRTRHPYFDDLTCIGAVEDGVKGHFDRLARLDLVDVHFRDFDVYEQPRQVGQLHGHLSRRHQVAGLD